MVYMAHVTVVVMCAGSRDSFANVCAIARGLLIGLSLLKCAVATLIARRQDRMYGFDSGARLANNSNSNPLTLEIQLLVYNGLDEYSS